jgi:chromate transporter
MVIKAPPKWMKRPASINSIVLLGVGFWEYEPNVVGKIAWFFTKAGAFVFGSGLAIVPFLHSGVVTEYQWLTEHEFLDAVAVANDHAWTCRYNSWVYRIFSCWISRRSGCSA